MFKLDSLNFKLKGLMSANIKSLALETEKAEVTHGEDPALCIVDGLPRLLLERYYKGRRGHFN